MKIIINADDFGLSEGINDGIIKSHKDGVVLSTTIMANGPAYKSAVKLAKENPNLGVGIHLVATFGKPLRNDVPTLVDGNGNFKRVINGDVSHIDEHQLFLEWCTQIEKVSEDITLTHFDSHHHIHLNPKLKTIIEEISIKYNIPYRGKKTVAKTSVRLEESFYKEGVTIRNIESLLQNNDQAFDLMVHPAYLDKPLAKLTSYYNDRLIELKLLCSMELKELIDSYNVEICTYKSI